MADNPGKEFYSEEISIKAKCSKASASILLKKLFNKGIVFRTIKGHMKFYQLNPKNMEFKKFRINAAIDELAPILGGLKKYSRKIILFGSASRGEQAKDSDFDLFILSVEKEKVKRYLRAVKAKIPIRAIIKNDNEWAEMAVIEPEFYREIKSGITLYEYVQRI